jgi:hypothetical protein
MRGTFAPVATGVTGTTFVDNLVSGGQTYGYRVTTAEAAGSCESAPSACQTITVSGACPCFDAPSFAGLASVTTPFSGTCTLDLSWSAGTAVCGGVPPVYNVYRSTNPSFVPGPSNRIATCVSGNAFSDAGGLAQDSPVYYVVRAEDGSGTGRWAVPRRDRGAESGATHGLGAGDARAGPVPRRRGASADDAGGAAVERLGDALARGGRGLLCEREPDQHLRRAHHAAARAGTGGIAVGAQLLVLA